jgi:putative AlgH/UPF0301 family transcriptional regulator
MDAGTGFISTHILNPVENKKPFIIRPDFQHKNKKQKVFRGTTLFQQSVLLPSISFYAGIRPRLLIGIGCSAWQLGSDFQAVFYQPPLSP